MNYLSLAEMNCSNAYLLIIHCLLKLSKDVSDVFHTKENKILCPSLKLSDRYMYAFILDTMNFISI